MKMKIDIVERDKENGHYDIYIDDIRKYAIRGEIGNLFIRHEGNKFNELEHNFRTLQSCLIHIFNRLLDKFTG